MASREPLSLPTATPIIASTPPLIHVAADTSSNDVRPPSSVVLATAHPAHQDHEDGREWVLVVPNRLTQHAFAVLVAAHCVPRPWHLEGRYGSRTHVHGPGQMGIPVLSADVVHRQASAAPETPASIALRALLDTTEPIVMNEQDGGTNDSHETRRVVELVYKTFTPSKRAHEPPPIDARMHPERDTSENPVFPTNDTPSPPPLGSFTYAELFAGIGGFGVALRALGGTGVFVSELEESCRHVYAANFHGVSSNPSGGDSPNGNGILHGDIYEVKDTDLPTSLDLLVGGFPCQPFSSMGEQPGLACPKGNLFLEIVRVLRVSKPHAFLLENVPGLVQMPETLTIIVQALEHAGYDVSMEVYDARGLTATSRKRLYIVGLRRRDHENPNESQRNPHPFEFPFAPDLSLRARHVISYQPLSEAEEALYRITDAQLERLNTEKYWRPAHLAWPNCIVDTLVSHYGTSIARGHSQLVPASAHTWNRSDAEVNTNPRRFTPRECARLMGFPSSYIIPDKVKPHQDDMARAKELYTMFGNAVCPPVIAVLGGAVLAHCPHLTHCDWVAWGRCTAVRLAREAIVSVGTEGTWEVGAAGSENVL